MKTMKHWSVDYSIKYINGKVKEGNAKLEARNITIAVGLALANIRKPLMKDPEISDVVIWDVGIVEDEVFEDEDEGNN